MEKKICFFLWLFVLTGCSYPDSKFVKLKNRSLERSYLYILRPSRVPLALWKQKISILKYSGTFQNSVPSPVMEIYLGENEYICLSLDQGYYLLKSRDSEKILNLELNQIYFLDYLLFNVSFLSYAELFFKDLDQKRAVEFLIEGSHMDRHPNSMD